MIKTQVKCLKYCSITTARIFLSINKNNKNKISNLNRLNSPPPPQPKLYIIGHPFQLIEKGANPSYRNI